MQRREFDLLVPTGHVDLGVRPAKWSELPKVFEIAKKDIPALSAAFPYVEGAINRNSESILVFHRNEEIVGVYAMLLLSASGLERLLVGELDTSAPDIDAIVRSGEEPSAIYNWAVVAHRLASEGFRHASVYLRQPRFQRANIYARGTTPAACRIMEHTGYQLLGGHYTDLYRYVRLENRQSRLPLAA